MGDNTSNWDWIKATIQSLWKDFVWFCMPGTEIRVPDKEGPIIVGIDDPRWYDVGASLVEVWSDDPHDHYGPWLKEHVGRKYIDWQLDRHIKVEWDHSDPAEIHMEKYVLIKIRNPQWATVAGLAFAKG